MSYDLIVIGGGAAGLMAAGRAGECGARVLLLEKNERVGVKLLLTGKERCNLTNNISVREMVKAFGSQGKFLFSALSRFDSASAIDFFTQRGVKIKIEDNNRAFPVSDKARDILAVLLDYIRQSQVEVITGA
ncbi:MAG: NAD(P)/FAD-dependent oxidoreductase, partial [Patescibacteria group bacterium]